MVRGIFVQIRQAQQKLQHAVALFRVRLGRAFLEIRDDREGVRKEPFDDLRIDRAAFAESLHDLIGAEKASSRKWSRHTCSVARLGGIRFAQGARRQIPAIAAFIMAYFP